LHGRTLGIDQLLAKATWIALELPCRGASISVLITI